LFARVCSPLPRSRSCSAPGLHGRFVIYLSLDHNCDLPPAG
jgi:hypothetical protein